MSTIFNPPPPPPEPGSRVYARPTNRTARILDTTMRGACALCAGIAILCLVLIVGFVTYQGIANLNWSLLSRNPGPPKPETPVADTNDDMTLVHGDAYRGEQAIIFKDADTETHWPKPAAGTQYELTITSRKNPQSPPLTLPGGTLFEIPADRQMQIPAMQALRFEATARQTNELTVGSRAYDFKLEAKAAGQASATLAKGRATVQDRTGMLNGIEGTLVLILLSSIIGVPLGIACGTYLAEYGREKTRAKAIRLVIDILVGVPSILVGVLAFQLAVHPPVWAKEAVDHVLQVFNSDWSWNPGLSAWAGAIALAFIMFPIVARTTEEMLKLVPQAYREASIGVGASKAQTIFRVVLPAARGGIITGIMLAVARVAGETAPLIFTIGGNNQPVLDFSRKGAPIDLNNQFPALPLQIFSYASTPEDEWVRQAWGGMLVLILLVLVLNLLVRFTTAKLSLKRR